MATNEGEGSENEIPEGEQPEDDIEIPENFDPKRAMKTIHTQRESEEKAIARAKAAEAKIAELESAEADKNRSLEEKVSARDQTIKDLRTEISESAVETDFTRAAALRGYSPEDVALALLAAQSEGVLGKYDPKAGVVGDHDFETLEAKYPQFSSEEDEEEEVPAPRRSGDAGRRGGHVRPSAGDQFNQAVRRRR